MGEVLVLFGHNYGVWSVSVGCKVGLKTVKSIWCPFFQFQLWLGQLEIGDFKVLSWQNGVWRVSRVHLGDV